MGGWFVPIMPETDDSTYRRWSHGLCCCCGGDICEGTYGGQPRAIGEGVLICGRCAENEHDEPPIVEAMLYAIATRDDTAIEEAINHASVNMVTDNYRLRRYGQFRQIPGP